MKTVIYNAKVYLRRNEFAEAVLVDSAESRFDGGAEYRPDARVDSRISAVGSNADILDAAPANATRIDAGGKLLLPGFCDSHLHFHAFGQMANRLDMSEVSSIEQMIEQGRREIARIRGRRSGRRSGRISACMAGRAEVVLCGDGFNQENCTTGKRYPTRDDLDKITTEFPLVVFRVCGHILFCNTKMLERMGLAESACGFPAGEVWVDAESRPNGIMSGGGAALARSLVPRETGEEVRASLRFALGEALANGITSAGSFDTDGPDFQEILGAYRSIYGDGDLHPRVSMQCGTNGSEKWLNEYIKGGYITGKVLSGAFLKMGPLKLFADGSLGSRTALLRAPYADEPDSCGIRETDAETLAYLVKKAAANNMQVAVHAIGDGGIESVVDCFEHVTTACRNPLRHGIIHCQITDGGLLRRIADNGILTLVQPIFLARDLHIAEARLGRERAASSYAWGSMEKLGIHCSYGTDCPVEPINPLLGIACAVTRTDPKAGYPEGGFFPAERVDVATAVDNYTISGAFSNFDENRLGRIRAGCLADLVLVDRDIFAAPPEEIHRARVVWTMLNGEVVYEG
jgi:predicted amidohydrolase YtcJ